MTSFYTKTFKLGFPNGSVGKEYACNAGDMDLNPACPFMVLIGHGICQEASKWIILLKCSLLPSCVLSLLPWWGWWLLFLPAGYWIQGVQMLGKLPWLVIKWSLHCPPGKSMLLEGREPHPSELRIVGIGSRKASSVIESNVSGPQLLWPLGACVFFQVETQWHIGASGLLYILHPEWCPLFLKSIASDGISVCFN